MEDTVVGTAVVANPHGIHARPSHAIVSTACEYQARIELRCDGRVADARSILAVMTLGAGEGTSIEVAATGEDAAQAVEHLIRVLQAAEGDAGKEAQNRGESHA